MGGIILVGIIWVLVDLIKEACEPTMTRKNWDNIEPYDAFNLSAKDFQKKLKGNKTHQK